MLRRWGDTAYVATRQRRKIRSANRRRNDGLIQREQEVAKLVVQGLTNREIAERLVLAEGTAKIHVQRILNKLGLRSRTQLTARAAEWGLTVPPTG
ncbi:MAG: response regulator transcription factor [Chloroflexi bacterium]|nr:response regulator transcription factor [Chloroflexota bacterium]